MFVEISKDHFINIDYVKRIFEIDDGWTVVMENEDRLKVSPDYQADFCKAIKENCSPWEKYNS